MDEQGLPCEVTKFDELSWIRSVSKRSKLAEQWKDAHSVGKLKRADEHLLVIRGLIRSARAGRRQARGDKWNLVSVKAVMNRIRESKATSVAGQKYVTNQVLDEHRRTPLRTRCAWDTGPHCRARLEIIWTKELAEAETASHAADSILSSPDMREIESLKSTGAAGQTVATEEVHTDQIVERDSGVSCQLDENQLQTMDV